MSTIYKFLQKRKIRKAQNGFYVMCMAYLLSFVFLFMGTNSVYRMSTKASGADMPLFEETSVKNITERLNSSSIGIKRKVPSDFIKLEEREPEQSDMDRGDMDHDSYWLLGLSMDQEEYQAFMEQMPTFESLAMEKESNAQAIKSFAAKVSDVIVEEEQGPKKELPEDQTSDKQETEKVITEKQKTKKQKTEKQKSEQDITSEEVEILERLVEAEATGEDLVGKVLVANVVLNRVEDDEFPDTVEGVVFHKVRGKYQFSPITDKRFWSVRVTKETKEAVKRAIKGEDHSQGALYFMSRKRTSKKNASWFDKKLKSLFQHGGHEFYKNK